MPPLRFRNVQVKIDLRQALRRSVKEEFGELGESLFDTAYQAFKELATPIDPYTEQDMRCPCGVPVYLSGNGILLCLKCGRRFGAVYPEGPVATPPSDRQRSRRGPNRTFRVKVNGGAPRPSARSVPKPPAPPSIDQIVKEAYSLLGLGPKATAEDVKKRRRELALIYHEDVGGNTGRMSEINAAADLLLERLS